MPIDLKQLLPTFVEESLENVEEMEEALLKLDLADIGSESINQIFRAVHTIKGNCAIFKFSTMSDLAKNLENLLDSVRKKNFNLEQSHVSLLLKSSDCFRTMLLDIKNKGNTDGACAQELITNVIQVFKNNGSHKIEEQNKEGFENLDGRKKTEERGQPKLGWIIRLTPNSDTFKKGNKLENIFSELKNLGSLEASCEFTQFPDLVEYNPMACYLSWILKLYSPELKETIKEILMWGADESEIALEPMKLEISKKRVDAQIANVPTLTSIRVATEKIDTLMNTVEELVITESVLRQITQELDAKTLRKFTDNLEGLEQQSRRLQDVILRMRMLPIAFAISRFPRMVKDIAQQLKKEVEFKISGEQTEIDKTMVEKITDPIMHLIRNAIDHGIETPDDREKNGKKRAGTIELIAYQSGNNIIIDIQDDGRGLSFNKIRESAIKKGLVSESENLKEEDCYQLIFRPGFSTAETITDISGRGVGLDVVMQNIHELGGKVEVISSENKGATFRLRLPLTLAIMDCQLIKVGKGFYAIPLSMIHEMSELDEKQIIKHEDDTESYKLRDEAFKLIHLDKFFFEEKERTENDDKNIEFRRFLIEIKTDETNIGFTCDALLFQQQVVIKSIEENYHKVPGILGATVLGDGELALILDVREIAKMSTSFISISKKTTEPFISESLETEVKQKQKETKINQRNLEYLCFLVENQEYGFNMQDIQEVCVWQKYALLPFSPLFVEGVMNLRGKIVPIINPRVLFNLRSRESNRNAVVIIIQSKTKNKAIFVGIAVDAVTDMNTIHYTDIEAAVGIKNKDLETRIDGLANIHGKIVTLLSTDQFVIFPETKWGVV